MTVCVDIIPVIYRGRERSLDVTYIGCLSEVRALSALVWNLYIERARLSESNSNIHCLPDSKRSNSLFTYLRGSIDS